MWYDKYYGTDRQREGRYLRPRGEARPLEEGTTRLNRTCPDEGAVKDCDQERGWSGREERLLKDMDGEMGTPRIPQVL